MTGHKSYVEDVSFSRDGRLLASTDLKRLTLWDAVQGQRLQELSGRKDTVTSVLFSPDGRSVASSSWDRTILLWDVQDFSAQPESI